MLLRVTISIDFLWNRVTSGAIDRTDRRNIARVGNTTTCQRVPSLISVLLDYTVDKREAREPRFVKYLKYYMWTLRQLLNYFPVS